MGRGESIYDPLQSTYLAAFERRLSPVQRINPAATRREDHLTRSPVEIHHVPAFFGTSGLLTYLVKDLSGGSSGYT